jgi:rod shape-determining protein MreC
MQKRNFVSYFLIFLALSLIIFGASKIGLLKPLDSLGKGILSPFQALTYGTFAKITELGSNPQIEGLKAQNLTLTKKLIDQSKLIADNKALRDQFQTQNPKSSNLIEADVIGAPAFIPGISVPETLILDRGESDGVKVGQAVVYEDNLIGQVVGTSLFSANVMLVTNPSLSFTAKTLTTQSPGVIKGQSGEEMILDNVVLSDSLQKQDMVLTKGDVNASGLGLPPDLAVGRINAISKNPSDLFQKADVKSLIDFSKLTKVFVIVNYQ